MCMFGSHTYSFTIFCVLIKSYDQARMEQYELEMLAVNVTDSLYSSLHSLLTCVSDFDACMTCVSDFDACMSCVSDFDGFGKPL